MLLVFHCCDKTPEEINLKRGRNYFASSFTGFNPWSFVSVDFGPVTRQTCHASVMAGSTWWSKAAHLMVAGSTDWKGWEPNVPFEGMNP
jgi:hypothetical protein